MLRIVTAQICRGTLPQGSCFECRHEFDVLGLVAHGAGRCVSEECVSPAEPPWLSFVPRGDKDTNMLHGSYESCFVCFQWDELKVDSVGQTGLLLDYQGIRERGGRYARLDNTSLRLCSGLIENMRMSLRKNGIRERLHVCELFYRLFRTYLRLCGEGDDDPVHRELAHYRELIRSNAFERVGLETLAERCRMSSDHLCRLFISYFGVTPGQYRKRLRMMRAHDLLESSTMNVGEIARVVGYDDPLYFSRVFKGHFGMAPSRVVRMQEWPRSE